MNQWIIGGSIIIVLAVGGFFLIGTDTEVMMDDDSMMEESGMEATETIMPGTEAMGKDEGMTEGGEMMQKGSYEPYAPEKLAKATKGDVVLFFRATWCPTCKALDGDIRANLDRIPADLTILDVNYDTETSLKQKYYVTYQHTLVQVDAEGTMITKWSGGLALSDLISKVQ